MADIFTYPDNRAYFRFAQDPVNKDFAVYLSDPAMIKTYQVVGRSTDAGKGITTVINSCTKHHLGSDGQLPSVAIHG